MFTRMEMCNCFEGQKTFSQEKFVECFQKAVAKHEDLFMKEVQKSGIEMTEEAGYKFGKDLFKKVSADLIEECVPYAKFINDSRYASLASFNKDSARNKIAAIAKIAANERSEDDHASMGICNFILGNYAEAILHLDQVLLKDPGAMKANIFKAWALEQTKQYDEALVIYTRLSKETGNVAFDSFAALTRMKKKGKL
jgi:tetratricopeptide (TPR) repeat protein